MSGYVDDPELYLRETTVFIVPLLAGGGVRVKILDAWCWGLPVVSTTIGAEGIDYRESENLIIANTSSDFGVSVLRVWRDRQFGDKLICSARQTVENRYDWAKIYRRLYEPYISSSQV